MPASGYTAITFVADQLLTSTVMNQMAANDAAFNNGNGFNDSIIKTRHLANSSDLQIPFANLASAGYETLGRTTLASPATSLEVASFAGRRNLRVMLRLISPSTTTPVALRFNGDTGNNYGVRRASDGGADTTDVSANSAIIITNTSADIGFYLFDVSNIATTEKAIIGHSMRSNTGAGTTPTRDEWIVKWANTANQITTIRVYSSGATFGTGSTLVVLGMD